MSDTPPKRGRGRLPFIPTKEQRAIVTAMRAGGVDHEWIASFLKISRSTLEKKFKEELKSGRGVVGARLTYTAIQKALAGDKTMLIFVLKTQFNWKETAGHQWLNKNGEAISFDSLDDSSLDQVITALKAAIGTSDRGGGED